MGGRGRSSAGKRGSTSPVASKEVIEAVHRLILENNRISNSDGTVITTASGERILFTDSQLGDKISKHARDFGLDPSNEEDREKFAEISQGIVAFAEEIRVNDWRVQPNPCKFYRRGNDVVVVNADNEYVTTLKDGATRNNRWLKGRRVKK